MAGTMTQADLVIDLKAFLMDAEKKFVADADADFIRHLNIAALDMGRVRSRTLVGSISLVADQPTYAAPADLLRVKFALWGTQQKQCRKPWESNYPGRLPSLSLIEANNQKELALDPPPTAAQIADIGATYRYYYYAGHQIDTDATKTSIQPGDRHLLLVRATAQALQELANNGITKPVKLGGQGVGAMPKNGTPAALSKDLLELFEEMAA